MVCRDEFLLAFQNKLLFWISEQHSKYQNPVSVVRCTTLICEWIGMYVTGVRYGIPNKDLVFTFDMSEKGRIMPRPPSVYHFFVRLLTFCVYSRSRQKLN